MKYRGVLFPNEKELNFTLGEKKWSDNIGVKTEERFEIARIIIHWENFQRWS